LDGEAERNPFSNCPGCGRAGLSFSGGKKISCPACGFVFYLNAAASTAAIIEAGDEILFAVRGREPGKGLLDLPGGFIDPGERAEEGLIRELREELGLVVAEDDFSFLCSYPNRYEYKGVLYRTCDLIFTLPLRSKPLIGAQDDVADLRWIRKDEIILGEIAFESIRRAVGRFLTPSSDRSFR
jgi:ADP-ribose pyrophosphatase YjhB (NUDIX family)